MPGWKITNWGTSLAVQWLKPHVSSAVVQVHPLVGELGSLMLCAMARKKKKKFFLSKSQTAPGLGEKETPPPPAIDRWKKMRLSAAWRGTHCRSPQCAFAPAEGGSVPSSPGPHLCRAESRAKPSTWEEGLRRAQGQDGWQAVGRGPGLGERASWTPPQSWLWPGHLTPMKSGHWAAMKTSHLAAKDGVRG